MGDILIRVFAACEWVCFCVFWILTSWGFLVLLWLIGRSMIFRIISAVVGLRFWTKHHLLPVGPHWPRLLICSGMVALGRGFVQQQLGSPSLFRVCISSLRNFTTAVLQELSHNAVLKVNCTFWSCNCGLCLKRGFFHFELKSSLTQQQLIFFL